MTAKLQTISRGFMRQLNSELDSIDADGDLRGAMKEVQDLRRQVDDLRRELKSSTLGTVEEGRAALREGKAALEESKKALNQSILPPQMAAKQNDNGRSLPQAATDAISQQEAPEDSAESSEADFPTASQLPNIVDVPDDPE